MKYQISRKTGIPLTKSGRDQKVGRILTKGCLSSLKMVVLIAFLALVINAFLIQ